MGSKAEHGMDVLEIETFDDIVIGSGAGGSTTATLLAQAGRKVLVVEEGKKFEQGEFNPFSRKQMLFQYRSQGQLVALGNPPIAYAEGKCLGGSTEINSGLYHRISEKALDEWSARHDISDLKYDDLVPIFEEIEKLLNISKVEGTIPAASQVLTDGANRLNWFVQEIPRWIKYQSDGSVIKQSMTQTMIPRAESFGAIFVTEARVNKVIFRGPRAVGVRVDKVLNAENKTREIYADNVWVCAGAIQSAAILRRSGIRRNIGKTLAMHPTVKAVGVFAQTINDPYDVPVVQVREFAPKMSFGGSSSSSGMLGLALLRTQEKTEKALINWPKMAVYYAAIRSEGKGRVRVIPGLRDPLVTYSLTKADVETLRLAMKRLVLLLLKAGAEEVIPVYKNATSVTSHGEIYRIDKFMRRRNLDLMTVHTTSTIPMGGDCKKAPVNSYGQVYGFENLFVTDSSIIPESPGVNPQGIVMALAMRSVQNFLRNTP